VGWCNSIPETRDPKPVLNIEVSLYCKSYDLTCVKTSEALTDIDRYIDQFRSFSTNLSIDIDQYGS